MPTFAIEHMEHDEAQVPPWVQLEYKQIAATTAPSTALFSSLPHDACPGLPPNAVVTEDSILDYANKHSIPTHRICLLDPKATQEISPADDFDIFLFGGILGDDPPRDRTAELRRHGFPGRHLGPVQMTTDTAVAVTHNAVVNKVPLDKMPFVDHPTIRFNATESVEMPFKYLAHGGEPILPPGMRQLLYEDMNRGFDF